MIRLGKSIRHIWVKTLMAMALSDIVEFSDIYNRVSTSYASGPEMDPCIRHFFPGDFLPLLLIQEEQVVSNW